MRITTQSGSVYEIEDNRIRRMNASHEKRGDGDWQALFSIHPNHFDVGDRLVIVMGSLAHIGPDDHGTSAKHASPYTTRTTTPITKIEES